MKTTLLVLSAAFCLASYGAAKAATVEFHIKAGTGQNSWNDAASMLTVAVGDTVHIVNDDSIVHTLHTDNNTPCPHGTDMDAGGGSYDCVISYAFDPAADGPLHDHYYPEAKFWLTAK